LDGATRAWAGWRSSAAAHGGAQATVAAELGNAAADVGQPVPMLGAVKTNTGHTPRQTLADAGSSRIQARGLREKLINFSRLLHALKP